MINEAVLERKYEILCMESPQNVILSSGVLSGFTMSLLLVVFFIGALLLGGLFEFGMAKTGYLQNVIKSVAAEEPGAPGFWLRFCLGIAAFFVFAGAVFALLGVTAGQLRRASYRRQYMTTAVRGFIDVSFDTLFFFAFFLACFAVTAVIRFKGSEIIFNSIFPTERGYSFWSLAVFYIIGAVIVGSIFHGFWWSCYRFWLEKLSRVDYASIIRKEQDM